MAEFSTIMVQNSTYRPISEWPGPGFPFIWSCPNRDKSIEHQRKSAIKARSSKLIRESSAGDKELELQMGRKPSASHEADDGFSAPRCSGCGAPIGDTKAVKHIAVEAPDLRHLNGTYHELCAQPVVMLLSVLGLLNVRNAADPFEAPSEATDPRRRH